MKSYLTVVVIYISLIIIDVEYLFICILTIVFLSGEISGSSAQFFDCVVYFFDIELYKLLYIQKSLAFI